MKNESDVESIWNEMKNALKSTPTMVFSMIGDSDNFVPKLWPKSAFQKALVEAGKTGGGMLFICMRLINEQIKT